MTAIQSGEFVEPAKVTVAEFLTAEWLPSIAASVRPSTMVSYEMMVTRYIVPRIGSIRLQKLGAEHIGKLYRDLLEDGRVTRPKVKDKPQTDGETTPADKEAREPAEPQKHGLAPMTVRHVHACLHRALRDAVRRQRLTRNPADAVDPPQVKGSGRHEMATWTAPQVAAFLAATSDDRLGNLWRLMVSNGLRRGEALGLRWEDIDFEAGRLSVRRALVSAGYEVNTMEPKTKRGTRVIGLAPETVAALRQQAAQQAAEAQQWGDAWTASGYVFTAEDGRPLHPDRVSKVFDTAVRRAPVPRIRLHDLRHTCATLALQAGVHVKVISEMLGHATVSITLDTYSHVIPGMQDEAAVRIASLFSVDR